MGSKLPQSREQYEREALARAFRLDLLRAYWPLAALWLFAIVVWVWVVK